MCPHWMLSHVAKPPNGRPEPRPEAGAQRMLEGVGWTRWVGAWEGRDTFLTRLLHGPGGSPCGAKDIDHIIGRRDCCLPSVLHRHLPLYPFSSRLSSLRKRQSVPW